MDSQQPGAVGPQPNGVGPAASGPNPPAQPVRPTGPLNIPTRPTDGAYTRDFNDGAFAKEAEWGTPTPVVRSAQPTTPQPVQLPQPIISAPQPVAPPAPQVAPPPTPPASTPVSPATPPLAPPVPPTTPPVQPALPAPTAPPPPPPAPQVATQAPPAGTPLPAYMLPPSSQPKVATLEPQPQSASLTYPASQQPQPIATPIAPAPSTVSAAAPLAQPPQVQQAYGPSVQHLPTELADRLGEAQNSGEVAIAVQRNQRIGRLKGLISFAIFIGGIFLSAFLINQFIFQSYYVDGSSMEPTLQNDDRLIIDKVERTATNAQGKPYVPKRGEIVVLDSTIVDITGQNQQLIKRVIGLPGDTVIIDNGKVIIKNDERPDGFDVDKELGLHLPATYVDAPIEIKIPERQVFVMGDNRARNRSHDSRAFGPVEADALVGRLWARILPLDKAKLY